MAEKVKKLPPYEKEFNQLSEALMTFLSLNVIHEARLNDIEAYMASVYKKENKQWKKENLGEGERLSDMGDAPTSELFDLATKKDIFIIDYVSAIQESLFREYSLNSSFENSVNTIIKSRKESHKLKNTLKWLYPEKISKSKA
jgi:hypothetical protein